MNGALANRESWWVTAPLVLARWQHDYLVEQMRAMGYDDERQARFFLEYGACVQTDWATR